MRNNPDYSNMSQKDLVRAYLQGYAAYQEAAAESSYALRKLDDARGPREEEAAMQDFREASAAANAHMNAYSEIFPLLTKATKDKYLTMRAVAYQRADGTSSIQSAPQDVSRVRAMSRRNPSGYWGWKKNLQKALKDYQDRRPYMQGDIFADQDDRDMSGLDLSGADLEGADLREANLKDANLTGANLTGANLERANLVGADLTSATLTYAKLYRADLTDANLTNANLHRAGLSYATLTNAIMPDGTRHE